MVLLGDVCELEVESERAQDARLPRQRQHLDRRAEVVMSRPATRRTCERAHVLDVGEQGLVLLLDEHAAEQVAEQAHVAAQRFHGASLGSGRC